MGQFEFRGKRRAVTIIHRDFFILSVFLIVGTLCCAETAVFESDFNTDVTEEKYPKGTEIVTLSDAGRCLKISGHVKQVDVWQISVEPEKKYKLSFSGRIDSDFTVEQNDRAHIETLRTYGREASSYRTVFFDDAGNSVSSQLQRKLEAYGGAGFILTNNWYDYVLVFYTPPGVKTLKIRFQPRGYDTFIKHVRLSVDSEQGAVNCNPDFSYGELNYCGWKPQRDGRLYKRPDGVTVFVSGYGGTSPIFPLKGGYNYRMTARGQMHTKDGRINLVYFDAEGNEIVSRFLLRPVKEGTIVNLTPPEGTCFGAIVMYGVVLESFRVELQD